MAENSNIEWTDHTFNPWIGCTKVSPGCANCYAETLMDTRYGRVKWGKGQKRVRTRPGNWSLPVWWDKVSLAAWDAARGKGLPLTEPRRPRVFCASLADWLDDEVPIEWLADLLRLIRATPNLDWLLLTKRPQNWNRRIGDACSWMSALGPYAETKRWLFEWLGGWEGENGRAPANVWIGTTVEDQQRADERIPALLRIPARVRFLSCEPLLEAVNLDFGHSRHRTFESYHAEIHWVICGGESGHGARPALVEWYDDLRRQCEAAGVAFFMKQLGANVGTTNANAHDWPEHVDFEEVAGTPQFAGGRVILSDRKGGRPEDFPSELQVREFPEVNRP